MRFRRLNGILLISALAAATVTGCSGRLVKGSASGNAGSGGLAATSWSKFGGNAQNTSRGLGSGAAGKLLWKFDAGDDAGPSVIGPNGYLYFWCNDGCLYALDSANGRLKWKASIRKKSLWEKVKGIRQDSRNMYYPSPAVRADGTVYIGSPDGSIYALDGQTGAIKWKYVFAGDHFDASPNIGPDGTVYITAGDMKLHALDGSTGREKWSFSADDFLQSCPAIGPDGTVYLATNSGKLFAIKPSDGTELWRFSGQGMCKSPAVDDDGTVYLASDDRNLGSKNHLYALDGKTGKVRWEVTIQDYPTSSPAIGLNDLIYIGTSASGNQSKAILVALNKKTGTRRWEVDTQSYDPAPSVAADGTVYVPWKGNNKDQVRALDGKSGKKKWELPCDGSDSQPAIGKNGNIYVTSWSTVNAIR